VSDENAKFTCNRCGAHTLEEVMTDVTAVSEVSGIELLEGEALSIQYGDQTNDGGGVSHYQCGDCGKVIADNQEELYACLQDHCIVAAS
jgi:predicted RNA-binding Zn-ribbon protein involved in translation (DUF1610 family)